MNQLDIFLTMLCGHYDNKIQLDKFQTEGITNYSNAERHIYTMNDKIDGLPKEFSGTFVLEENQYTEKGITTKMPHLFLFIEQEEKINLISYELPVGYTEETFTYENASNIKYESLIPQEQFQPIMFKWKNECFYGKSFAMLSSTLKYTLEETVMKDRLLISETLEEGGKRIFGFDLPIVYRITET